MLGRKSHLWRLDMSASPEEKDLEKTGEPTDDVLEEPSTEKSPAEEPKATDRGEPEPSHEAVGIGVVGRPLVEPEQPSKES